MAGFEKNKDALAAAGATVVVAASVDPPDKSREVTAEVSFPVAHGATRAQADTVGAWWDEDRQIIQPAEFILRRDGTVVLSAYSSGPIGRIEPADAAKLLDVYNKREASGD